MKVKTHNRTTRRWIRRLALGTAVLAVAIPAAPALGSIPPEPAQPAPQVFVDLPKGLTVESPPADPLRDGPATGARSLPVVGTGTTSSFDWSDAAAGLGVGIAASALLALGVAGLHRRRGTLANV